MYRMYDMIMKKRNGAASVATYIDAHMAHDTDEGKQHDRFAEQLDSFLYLNREVLFVLL